MSRRDAAPSVDVVEMYVIVRREAWRTRDEVRAAYLRASEASDGMAENVRWIRTYVLAEADGLLGMVCVYEATSPEAIRRHSYAAGLPVDEIVAVADMVVLQPDPLSVTA
jgi:Protein of unknown function (DUF4242)